VARANSEKEEGFAVILSLSHSPKVMGCLVAHRLLAVFISLLYRLFSVSQAYSCENICMFVQDEVMETRGRTKISGEALRRLRFKLALTQGEMGQRIGLSEVRVRHIERAAQTSVHPRVFRKLAELAGSDVESFELQSTATMVATLAADLDKGSGWLTEWFSGLPGETQVKVISDLLRVGNDRLGLRILETLKTVAIPGSPASDAAVRVDQKLKAATDAKLRGAQSKKKEAS
jgi:transcriptional regulator with XRE-family HTH domain